MKESIQRAFGYLQSNKVRLGIAQEFDNDGLSCRSHRPAAESRLLRMRRGAHCGHHLRDQAHPGAAALVILGDISIQGNIKGVRTLVEPCQLAMENGAKRALIPLENKRNFLEVSGDIIEKVDPIFFSDPQTAAIKALGLA